MDDDVDLLKIKIEKAKKELPEETRMAIDAVPWQGVILQMRETRGYSFEQLDDLETETELLLCGLLTPEDYPKELETRMKIPKAKVNELVEEMNMLVFGKIKEELIKNSESNKKIPSAPATNSNPGLKTSQPITRINPDEAQVLDKAGIKIIDPLELPAGSSVAPIVANKLSGSFQTPAVKTEHTVENISKPAPKAYPPKADPYRMSPDE